MCDNNIESCVLNNGWSTDFLSWEGELNKAAPFRVTSVILWVEVLVETIRETKRIKAIMISQNEVKISQYADDTTIFLDGSK